MSSEWKWFVYCFSHPQFSNYESEIWISTADHSSSYLLFCSFISIECKEKEIINSLQRPMSTCFTHSFPWRMVCAIEYVDISSDICLIYVFRSAFSLYCGTEKLFLAFSLFGSVSLCHCDHLWFHHLNFEWDNIDDDVPLCKHRIDIDNKFWKQKSRITQALESNSRRWSVIKRKSFSADETDHQPVTILSAFMRLIFFSCYVWVFVCVLSVGARIETNKIG